MIVPERPRASEQLLDHLRHEFGLSWDDEPLDLGGSSSLNLLISDRRGDVVARAHRAWVGPGRLAAIQAVRAALRRDDFPVAETIPTAHGSPWTAFGEHLVEVERYIPGEAMNSWERLLTGMHVLGRMHCALAGKPAEPAARTPPTANQVSMDEALALVRCATPVIRSWARSEKERAAAAKTEALAEQLESLRKPLSGLPPRQLVHGDFWDNNVLFDAQSVVGILDFDFMAERERIDDLALVLYYANSGKTLPVDTTAEERRQRLRALVDAYDSGLSTRLSAAERAALPLALARVVLSYTRHLLQREHEREQRAVLAAWSVDLDWSLSIARDLGRWQEAFA